VRLISGNQGPFSILASRKGSQSQRGNPLTPRLFGTQFPN